MRQLKSLSSDAPNAVAKSIVITQGKSLLCSSIDDVADSSSAASTPPQSPRVIPVDQFTLHTTDKTSDLGSVYQAFVMGERNSGRKVPAKDVAVKELMDQMGMALS